MGMINFGQPTHSIVTKPLETWDMLLWGFRYTGGDNERVISSVGRNWLMGHGANQISRYYLVAGFIVDISGYKLSPLKFLTKEEIQIRIPWVRYGPMEFS